MKISKLTSTLLQTTDWNANANLNIVLTKIFFLINSFDADEKWKQYWQNASDTLPANASAAESERLQFKFKVKYFKQKIDGILPLLTFEEFHASSGSSSAASASSEVKIPYQLITVEAKEKHTATVIFMHGLGDQGVR